MAISDAKRQRLHAETKGRCGYCGNKVPLEEMTVDHVTPASKGGTDDEANLLCSCRRCNAEKGDKALDGFKSAIVSGTLYAATDRASKVYMEGPAWHILGDLVRNTRPIHFYFETLGLRKEDGLPAAPKKPRGEAVEPAAPLGAMPQKGAQDSFTCVLPGDISAEFKTLACSQRLRPGELLSKLVVWAMGRGKIRKALKRYAKVPKVFE